MNSTKVNLTYFFVPIVVLDIFTIISPDVLFYAALGLIGGMIGNFVRIVKRDEADVENKVNFFYLKDIFVTLTWSLVGGFLPVVFILQGWLPILAVLCSLFAPKFWDVMEDALPQILKSMVNKFWSNGSSNTNTNSSYSSSSSSTETKKETGNDK